MDAIVAQSKERIERGSKSFAAAAKLFSPEVRDDAFMLYAWCRHCDDVIDDQDFGFYNKTSAKQTTQVPPLERLKQLEEKTQAAIRGEATEPVFIALGRVVKKHAIPERHPMELLQGFQMDVEERSYHSLDDTLEYCYHVAGVVGVMMAMLMGVKDRNTLNRAVDLGLGFQLTNICRDVIEDATMGRVYLPNSYLKRQGIPEGEIANPKYRIAVATVVAEILQEADKYYRSSAIGIRHLPLRSGWAIAAAKQIYSSIGTKVRAQKQHAWDERVIISKSGKIGLLFLGLAEALNAKTIGRMLPETERDGLWTKAGLGT